MLFADDVVITAQSLANLQNALNLLESYCLHWSLEVNTKKTKVMVNQDKGICQLRQGFGGSGSILVL